MKTHAATYWGTRGRTFCGIEVTGRVGDTHKAYGPKMVEVATTRKPQAVTCGRCHRSIA